MAVTPSACQLQVLGYSHTVVEKSRADAESYLFCKEIEKSGVLPRSDNLQIRML